VEVQLRTLSALNVSEQLHTQPIYHRQKTPGAHCVRGVLAPQPVGAQKNLLSVSGIGRWELAAMPTELSGRLRLAKAEDSTISVRPLEPTCRKWNVWSEENDARR